MTTRGMKEQDFFRVGTLIGQVLAQYKEGKVLEAVKEELGRMARGFPLFAEEWLPVVIPA